uniref:Uncharacterized protein n=1 Tax=Caenorhabditis tropicalis TaxID=1561998 RepID=A0A1I7U220_9PELO
MERCFPEETLSSNVLTFFEFITNPAEPASVSNKINATSSFTPTTFSTPTHSSTPIPPAHDQKINVLPPRGIRDVDILEEKEGLDSFGSNPHINYLKETFDHAEDIRTNLTLSLVNHKLQFLAHDVNNIGRDNFNRLVETICHTRNRQLRIWRMFLNLDPQAVMRVLLHRDDIVAHFKGTEVVSVRQCKKITIHKIDESVFCF